MSRAPALTAKDEAKIVTLYGHGMTLRTIAERFGVGVSPIRRVLTGRGVVIDSRRREYNGGMSGDGSRTNLGDSQH